jgi:multiple sugar transport system permease protein
MSVVKSAVVGLYLLLATLPLVWMGLTSCKLEEDAISLEPKFLPRLESSAALEESKARFSFPAVVDAYRRLNEIHPGATTSFWTNLWNSVVIGLGSTLASVFLGTLAAYGFSRLSIAGAKDWLFFILSTRFLPPLAVVMPVLIMYRELDLQGSALGLVLLYTAFNLSLAVWLTKGFVDEIPRAFEEAALVDGYSRMAAFRKVVLPQARTGIAVTAVFCLVSAWNEYGFAMTLNGSGKLTVPAYFAGLQGNIDGMPWPQVCAGALIFVVPIVLFTVLVRKHLLRGMTFGTIKQ